MPDPNATQSQLNAVKNVAPTILLGLGGTGKEILLRLRRRFYERYSVFGFPTMGYLWVDTDTSNINIDRQNLDHIMEEVMFRDHERVNAEITSKAFKGYFADQTVHPHIFSWLDPRLAGHGQVINGAGQVRQLGRLAFFHRYSDIRAKLGKLRADITSQNAIEEMRQGYGIEVDGNALNILIVCSLAGGTGSGMFLDAAFMCRELFAPNIVFYLMLPSAFADAISDEKSKRIFANAYAALKELEFYSLRKDLLFGKSRQEAGHEISGQSSCHDFVVDWENKGRNLGLTPPAIQPPPFNTCYLIGNKTQGGGEIGPQDKTHLCDMIAENIFLNFSSEAFSRQKDSLRSNLDQFLGNPLFYDFEGRNQSGGYTEVYSQRFSTFGFSKLYVPVDRVRRACGYQLALDLVGRWLKRNELSAVDLDRLLQERELNNLGLRSGANDDLVNTLGSVGESNFGSEIQATVTTWREDFLAEIAEKRPNLYSLIPQQLTGFVQKNFSRNDPRAENWGEYIKTLEQNRLRFLRGSMGEFDMGEQRRTDGRILACVKAWLRDDFVRLPLTVEYLKAFSKHLAQRAGPTYQTQRDSNERTAQAALEDLKIKLEIVRDEESGWFVKRKSLRVLVEQTCDLLSEHLTAKMNGFILNTAIQTINDSLQPYIGKEEIYKDDQGQDQAERAGLILDLWSLQEELVGLYADLSRRFEAFETVQDHLIYENLYDQGMFRDYYKIKSQKSISTVENKLEELESRLLEHLRIPSPYHLRALIKGRGRPGVRYDMEEFCYRQFAELEVQADALELLERKYPDPYKRRLQLERFVKNGSVWLRHSEQAETYQQLTSNYAAKAIISATDGNQDRFADTYQRLEQLVQADGYPDVSRPATKTADAVYLYTEYAGIPLAYIHNIEHYYRDAYLPLFRTGVTLHIDSHDGKFTDILIKNNEEVQRVLDATKVLLIGAMLRVIKATKDGQGGVAFSYRLDNLGMTTTRPLGATRAVAVETLKSDERLRATIDSAITRRRLALSPKGKQKFFTLLIYHLLDPDNEDGSPAGPFAPDYPQTGDVQTPFYTLEYRFLEEIRGQVYVELETELGGANNVIQCWKSKYASLDDFSEEIMWDNHRIRILKDNFDS